MVQIGQMNALIRYSACCALAMMTSHVALAGEPLANRGNDPFFQVSTAIAQCPEALGPLTTPQEWLDDAHYRIERGNSCWIEGRCRLSNAYLYDAEIAESVRRRLQNIDFTTHWSEKSTLWLMLQRRFIYVQGCVSPDFDKARFLFELEKTADVDKVIDNTTTDPRARPFPYKTRAMPTNSH